MSKKALKAAQDVLHDVFMADMNPARAGKHVSTQTLTERMIKAYFSAILKSELNQDALQYAADVVSIGKIEAEDIVWNYFKGLKK